MEGITKREIFAAMAMQGILANPFCNAKSLVGEEAVKQADHLIAELMKRQTPDPALSDAHIRDALHRIYDIYGYAWPDPDRCMVRKVLGMEDLG